MNLKSTIKKLLGKTLLVEALLSAAGNMKSRYTENAVDILGSICKKTVVVQKTVNKPVVRDDIDLSVIVPAYNVEKTIAECLESIIMQKTDYRFEVVLVNDGSTDNTRETALDAVNGDERVTIIDQVNGGLASARNKGLDCCTGAAVTFIDSDDYIEEGFIQTLLNSLCKSSVDYIDAGYSDVDERGIKIGNSFSRERMGTAWGRVFKREIWADIRFPVGMLYEDAILSYLVKSRYSSKLIHNDSYCYRHRRGSISRSGKNPRVLETYWIVEYLLDECDRLDIPFGAVTEEFLTNSCFTVFGRLAQFDSKWLLPTFSAFADLWDANRDSTMGSVISHDMQMVDWALRRHNYCQWGALGLKNIVEGL